MFCPECKAEYRRGFTRCSDCDVDLVPELGSPASSPGVRESNARVIWRGVTQEQCVSCCYALQDEGIAYKVNETAPGLDSQMRMTRRYELFVSEDDYDRAKAVLNVEQDLPAALSEEEWRRLAEPEDEGEAAQSPEPDPEDFYPPPITDDFLRDLEFRRRAYREPWDPEDATVLVWDQDDEDISDVVEVFLKENYIHCRVDSKVRLSKVYVAAKDARAARDLVNQRASDAPQRATGTGFRFCPLCLSEFRPGFDRCSDCRVQLVATRAEAMASSSLLWQGDREETLDLILRVLDAVEIPAYQRERSLRPAIRAFGIPIGRQVRIKYEIRVFRSDLERARTAIADNPELSGMMGAA
jgi:hypothetical protein